MKKSFAILLLICLFFCSCSRNDRIVFNSDDSLSLAMDIQWAVVSDPYVAFRVEPGFEKDVKDHGRMGDILMVQGKRYFIQDGENVFWYYFDEGWLEENSIRVYDNKLKAETASKELLK